MKFMTGDNDPFASKRKLKKSIKERRQLCGVIPIMGDSTSYRCKNSEHNWKNPITETPFGLPNIGNTCYMNSSLQSLVNIDEFCECIEVIHSLVKGLDGYNFIKNVAYFIHAYKTRLQDDVSHGLSYIKKEIEKTHKQFIGKNQQDVSEFMEILIDLISSEVQTFCSKTNKKNNSFLDLFTFKIVQKKCVECPAGMSNDTSTILRCNIDTDDNNMMDLVSCIKHTVANASEFCSNCIRKHDRFSLRWDICPKILLIMLNRTNVKNGTMVKNHLKIKVPTSFHIGFKKFTLASIISHEGGSCSNGHWISSIRNERGQYFRCSDDRVKYTTEDEVMLATLKSSYVLFYKND